MEQNYVWQPQPRQADALACDAFELFFGGAKGGGKALSVETLIPTPEGWKRLGEIKAGAEVFGQDGSPKKVIASTEIMYNRPCYRLTFDTGQEVIADASHLWKTLSIREREQAARLTEEYRERRRETRLSRGTGQKKWLAQNNSERKYDYASPPAGTIRTTEAIALTLVQGNAKNHAITTCSPVQLREKTLPIDPYVLGVWLGDGTAANGAITKPDTFIIDRIRTVGYEVTKWSAEYAWGIKGLKVQLRDIGVLSNKHVPEEYLRASYNQRIELIQGLMDSDGTVGKNGSAEFTSTNIKIAQGFLELVRSIGIKATIREAPAKLHGVEVGTQYRIKFTTNLPVASLPRKALRLRAKTSPITRRHIIVKAEQIPSVPVKCIQIASDDGMYLCTESFIPTHNSDFLLGDYLQNYQEWGEAWRGIIFRRTYPELEEIISRSKEIYGKIEGATYVGGDQRMWRLPAPHARFPGLATLRFRSLESDLDVGKYNGHQYPWQGWDELTEFPSGGPYEFMIKCCRSASGAPCYMRATGNPGRPGHVWVKARFIDVAKPYEIFQFAPNPLEPEKKLTRCFIPSKLEDNLILMKNDPSYESRMMMGDAHLVKALRYGDWDTVVGQVLSEYKRERHVLKPQPLDSTWYRFCTMDWGFAKPFSIGWWAVSAEGRVIRYKEWYGCTGSPNEGLRMGSKEVAAKAWQMSINENVTVMVADPACWSKIDDSPSIADTFAAAGFTMYKANNDRVNGLQKLHEMMLASGEDGRPFFMVMENCKDWIRTVPVLTADPRNPEDIDTALEDHPYDDTRYAVMSEYVKNPRALRPAPALRVYRSKPNYDPLTHGL